MEASVECTYEGPLDHYLGCEIKRDRVNKRTIITQKHYARHVLELEGMWDCNPKAMPMVPNTRLSTDDQPDVVDPVLHKQYRCIVRQVGLYCEYDSTGPCLGIQRTVQVCATPWCNSHGCSQACPSVSAQNLRSLPDLLQATWHSSQHPMGFG